MVSDRCRLQEGLHVTKCKWSVPKSKPEPPKEFGGSKNISGTNPKHCLFLLWRRVFIMVYRTYPIAYSKFQMIDSLIGIYLGSELPWEPAHQGIPSPTQCWLYSSIDPGTEISRDFLWPRITTRLSNACEIFDLPKCETWISTSEDDHRYYSRAFQHDPGEWPKEEASRQYQTIERYGEL